ncbi:MAG: helix-turn-helix transcriptional regulator [Polyangiaceae bacterium]|jgi:AraC-like DNA-binding protein|nr:helix-turn-helix transcriptional regulator [Polyangiaceae bacterium]MBK8936280.1 helix-turn-helix transcriptional regulator [Polyangiaceae bacterium]
MENAPSTDLFFIQPVGYWTSAANCVVLCPKDDLIVVTVWGSSTPDQTAEALRALEVFKRDSISPRFNVLIDASRLEGLVVGSEGLLAEWVARHRAELLKRVRTMAVVESRTAPAQKLRELAAALGELPLHRVVGSLREALQFLSAGEDVAYELDAIADGIKVVPAEVRKLRQLLANDGSMTLEQAARALDLSTRGLNRSLAEVGSAFNDEVKNARYRKACYLLEATDDDPGTIANAVGTNEAGLNQLFKEKARTTPMDYRDQARSQLI